MHLFKTRLKCLLRNKTLIFWTLLFPLILSTLFKFAFTNITEVVVFNTINISVIESVHNEQEFISFLESVEITEGKKMFNVTLANSDEAMILLDNNQVTGIIEIKEDFQIFLTIKGSGLSERF